METKEDSKKIKQTESDIQKVVKEYLQWHKWFCVKIHQSLGSYRGIADLYCIRKGTHVWIEIKTGKGKQSEAQKAFQRDIEAAGGTYVLCRGIEDLKDLC